MEVKIVVELKGDYKLARLTFLLSVGPVVF